MPMDKDKISLYSIIITIVAIFLLMHISDLNRDLENERLTNAYLQTSVNAYYSVLAGNNDIDAVLWVKDTIDDHAQSIVNKNKKSILDAETQNYDAFLDYDEYVFNESALDYTSINSISKNVFIFYDDELYKYPAFMYDDYGIEISLDDFIYFLRNYD